jgi:hypothetical protein
MHNIAYNLSDNSPRLKCKLRETQLCNFCNEIKETIWLFFWKCNIVKSLWLEMTEIFKKKNECNVELLIVAQHITLGSDVLDYSINLYIVLITYGQQPCVINILKRTYEAEIQSASFYQTPTIRERIVKKCNILR